ncbi:hypothetical protein ABES01_22105 [Paenibacillus rhizolycopersici]|uniref:hypothetical protein n=1 Tax=Paenibacillus rhizolycopersici TaxID=2780073 RepID=UPI003D268570
MNNERIQEIKKKIERGMRLYESGLLPKQYEQNVLDDAYLLSEVERLQSQITEMEYPKAMGRDVTYGGWRLDYQFLHDVEMEIRKSVFWEECPSMEGIELALLTAQEVIKRRALSHLKGE